MVQVQYSIMQLARNWGLLNVNPDTCGAVHNCKQSSQKQQPISRRQIPSRPQKRSGAETAAEMSPPTVTTSNKQPTRRRRRRCQRQRQRQRIP